MLDTTTDWAGRLPRNSSLPSLLPFEQNSSTELRTIAKLLLFYFPVSILCECVTELGMEPRSLSVPGKLSTIVRQLLLLRAAREKIHWRTGNHDMKDPGAKPYPLSFYTASSRDVGKDKQSS